MTRKSSAADPHFSGATRGRGTALRFQGIWTINRCQKESVRRAGRPVKRSNAAKARVIRQQEGSAAAGAERVSNVPAPKIIAKTQRKKPKHKKPAGLEET